MPRKTPPIPKAPKAPKTAAKTPRAKAATPKTAPPVSDPAAAPVSSAPAPPVRPGRPPRARSIEIVGARTHNLKNISTEIPLGKLTVVTGPSGSGKSSLAFDTLYAEGQRRFVESMSTYARQFIEKMERPDVDHVRNIQPSIAIEQKNSVKNARSTIATATEISDYLRLLFAKGGKTICPHCKTVVREDTPQSVTQFLLDNHPGARVYVVAPVPRGTAVSGEALVSELIRSGYTRLYTGAGDRPFIDLEDDTSASVVDGLLSEDTLRVLVDRLAVSDEDLDRVSSAIATAFRAGQSVAEVYLADPDATAPAEPMVFRQGYRCNGCGTEFRRPEPNMFSFNSPLGACQECGGFGRVTGVDWDKVLPDLSLTLNQEPVAAFNSPSHRGNYRWLTITARNHNIPYDVPLEELDEEKLIILKYGANGDRGIVSHFTTLESERYKVQSRIMVARYRGYSTCHKCMGTRLAPAAQNVFWEPEQPGSDWQMRNMGQVSKLSISHLLREWETISLLPHEIQAVGRVYREVLVRLQYLHRVGLGYLTLDRQTRTLSGGEAQRINLATALGTALTQTLYVLDEPTVGLHPRDSRRLLEILLALRDKGNTLVVVEHDPELILGADHLLDIGPAAGSHGGQVIFEGTPDELKSSGSASLTGRYLFPEAEPETKPAARTKKAPAPKAKATPEKNPPVPNPCLEAPMPQLRIVNARENNLRRLTVEIPLNKWVCITGVSGSGKSTLVHNILYQGFNQYMRLPCEDVGKFERIEGLQHIGSMVLVDQSAIGRSTRSNPVTYVKAYDSIRKLLGATREARSHGITDSHFSFNIPGGRCETCEGAGVVSYDMHFLAEVTLPCEDCNGKRFMDRVLEITWNGKNVDEILAMTVDDANEFFAEEKTVLRRLEPLRAVGLGYLTLGQSTATLSGGEAQRLKLASHLAGSGEGAGKRVMMIFDEPTTGLHLSDLAVLSQVFRKLVENGYSLVIIEHNLEIIRQADWVIDLGPEAGTEGGQLVACGPPIAISQVTESHTGRFLKEIL